MEPDLGEGASTLVLVAQDIGEADLAAAAR
jgi:hypothetical protein